MQRTPITHFLTAALCALPLALCGCSDQSAAGLGSAGSVTPSAADQASREKMRAEAPANPVAQAVGGSGMPSAAQGPGGSSSGVAGAALVDKPANPSAQAAGGSGMPGPH